MGGLRQSCDCGQFINCHAVHLKLLGLAGVVSNVPTAWSSMGTNLASSLCVTRRPNTQVRPHSPGGISMRTPCFQFCPRRADTLDIDNAP